MALVVVAVLAGMAESLLLALIAAEPDLTRGCGPAIANLDAAPSTQGDADDLLDALGL